MSESLRISHGDLALNGNTFTSVSGGEKLIQDLRCALLTQLGTYRGQPEFGSTLELPAEGIIGSSDWRGAATLLQAEINRICSDHQRRQISRNREDANRFGRLTIGPGETLLEVESIQMIQAEDRLLVLVTLKTGANKLVKLQVPLEP